MRSSACWNCNQFITRWFAEGDWYARPLAFWGLIVIITGRLVTNQFGWVFAVHEKTRRVDGTLRLEGRCRYHHCPRRWVNRDARRDRQSFSRFGLPARYMGPG
jgi:hypothetical protein